MKVRLLLILLLLPALLLSCGGQKWERLENFNGQFSIDYPVGWEYSAIEGESEKLQASFSYRNVDITAHIFAWVTESNYFALRDSFLNDDEYSRLIEVEDAISINNQIYSLFSGQNLEVKMLFLIIWINDDETMAIVCKTNDFEGDTFGKLIEYSRHMLNSLEITS